MLLPKAQEHNFWPEKVFSTNNPPPPKFVSKNDQRDVGIILSHRCWVAPPPPPRHGRSGTPALNPPSHHGGQGGGGGGGWENGLPCPPPPPPQSNFLPARHSNHWAPRTRKRHLQEHRPQRPSESSDPTQHAKGRTGDYPGPHKETTTRRNVTRGGKIYPFRKFPRRMNPRTKFPPPHASIQMCMTSTPGVETHMGCTLYVSCVWM